MKCRRSKKKKEKKKAVNRTVLTNCSNKENNKVCDNLFFVRKKDALAVHVSSAALYPAILFWSKNICSTDAKKAFVTKRRVLSLASKCIAQLLFHDCTSFSKQAASF